MRRRRLWALGSLVVVLSAAAPSVAQPSAPLVQRSLGPVRLLTPSFGYAVAYRTTSVGSRTTATTHLFLYDSGRWRDATPPTLAMDGDNQIDDVAFVDRRHGWVAGFDCATARVHLYRTNDGGESWMRLGRPAYHSCGGGPTYLSFVDTRQGWMEPVSPNAPAGVLLQTRDGGKRWRQIAAGPPGQVPGPALPCLAPIRFATPVRGWMARCPSGGLYRTVDGGRVWTRIAIAMRNGADARFDVPWSRGGVAVVAATIGTTVPSRSGRVRAVVFALSHDAGRSWTVRSRRTLSSCPLAGYVASPGPTSIAGFRTWWIVDDAQAPTVRTTTDAGRSWHATRAHGLPSRPCVIASVTAVGAKRAWAVVRIGARETRLFATRDGGRNWRPAGIPGA